MNNKNIFYLTFISLFFIGSAANPRVIFRKIGSIENGVVVIVYDCKGARTVDSLTFIVESTENDSIYKRTLYPKDKFPQEFKDTIFTNFRGRDVNRISILVKHGNDTIRYTKRTIRPIPEWRNTRDTN